MSRHLLILAFFALLALPCLSQNVFNSELAGKGSDSLNKSEPKIEQSVWSKFIKKTIDYDVAAFNNAPRGVYIVKVQFTVFEDGRLGNFVPLTKFGYGMERAVVKALEKSPLWQPAIVNGKPVKAEKLETIRFVVDDF